MSVGQTTVWALRPPSTVLIPGNVVVGNDDIVYVGDTFNHLVRKIDTIQNVTSYAGTGSIGYDNGVSTEASFFNPRGVAVYASGVLYVAEYHIHQIRKIDTDRTVSTYAGTAVVRC